MPATRERTRIVLLVDADPGDVRLMELALARTGRSVRLHCVSSGEAALRFLHRAIPYEDAPEAHLVLLDLHLPAASGPACLAALRADPETVALPVVALSSTDDLDAVHDAYRLGASAVIVRPQGLHDLVAALDATLEFYLETASVPARTDEK